MLLPSLLVLLLLFLLISLSILRFHAREVERRKLYLIEALWERRHRVPVLIESTVNSEQQTVKGIIDIRAKLQSGAYTLEEEVAMEKQLTHLITDLFQKTEFDTELKANSLYLSLQKEFSDCLEKIRINLNDYNFSLQKFLKLCRLPFFLIFKFAFEISKNRPLEPF